MYSVCTICSRRVLSHSCLLRCASCSQYIHRHCLLLSHDEFVLLCQIPHWYCHRCNELLFPFNQITGPSSINPIRLTFSIGLGEITILIAFTSSINAIESDISNPRFEILINLAKWIGLLVSGRFHYALKLYVSLPGIAKDRYSIEWSGTLFILIGNIRSWIGKSQSTSSRSIRKLML